MITGYNTDVEHDGVVYHVQTEDKGIGSPVILSLVYVGGAILASKRSPYDDLITSGFDERLLVERLQRQHRLICAAIHAGRIDDLRRLSQRDPGEPPVIDDKGESAMAVSQVTPVPAVSSNQPEQVSVEAGVPSSSEPTVADQPWAIVAEAAPESEAQVREAQLPEPQTTRAKPAKKKSARRLDLAESEPAPAAAPPDVTNALQVDLLEERQLRGGEFVTLRVRVSRGTENGRKPVANAHVIVKTLGSSFRPASTLAKTDRDGVAMIFASLPAFSSGRAAVLIKAASDGDTVELRRIILPTEAKPD